jgi:hypothetical protein
MQLAGLAVLMSTHVIKILVGAIRPARTWPPLRRMTQLGACVLVWMVMVATLKVDVLI